MAPTVIYGPDGKLFMAVGAAVVLVRAAMGQQIGLQHQLNAPADVR